MTTDEYDRIRSAIHAAIDDPERAFSSLLDLLEGLEHEDRSVRIGAAWALCLLAEARPDAARVIFERCAHRESAAARCGARWLLQTHGTDAWLERLESEDAEHGPLDAGDAERQIVFTDRDGSDSTGDPSVATVSDDRKRRPERLRRARQRSDESDDEAADEDDGDDTADADSETTAERDRSADATGVQSADRRIDRWDGGRGPTPDREDAVVEGGAVTIDPDRTAVDDVRYLELVSSDRYSRTYLGVGDVGGRSRELLVRAYVPPEGASEPQFRRAFRDAVTRWESIDGTDGVMTVLDWGTAPDPWVVTDFASATVRSAGRLSPRNAYRAGASLATAVARAHENGIVHGSLSPHAVFLDRSGETPAPRVVDFGVGTALRDAGGPLPLRQAGAAPELLDEAYGGLDWMTDVYQLGIVLYAMITGRRPAFPGSNPSSDPDPNSNSDAGVDRPALPDPTDIVDGLPPETDRIVAKATAPHKIARYESAAELARDLRATLEDHWLTVDSDS